MQQFLSQHAILVIQSLYIFLSIRRRWLEPWWIIHLIAWLPTSFIQLFVDCCSCNVSELDFLGVTSVVTLTHCSLFDFFSAAQWPMLGLGHLIVKVPYHTCNRTALNEWSVHCRGHHYVQIHTKHKRQTYMLSVRFEPAIPAIKWLQTYASKGTAIEIILSSIICIICQLPWFNYTGYFEFQRKVGYTCFLSWTIHVYLHAFCMPCDRPPVGS